MRVERLPFTIYDIVGYFLPGAALLASIVVVLFPDTLAVFHHNGHHNGGGIIIPVYEWVVIGVFLSIISYALGYCIALISSEGIENSVIKTFGYPSEFLVRGSCNPEGNYKDDVSFVRKMFLLHYLLRRPSGGWVRDRFESIFVKKLTKPVIKRLGERLKERFGIDIECVDGEEWFSLIRHYVMNNNHPAFLRMYNYMTVYGFCRNFSAALYCSIVILFFGLIVPSILLSLNLNWLDLSWLDMNRRVSIKACFAIALMIPLSGMLAANFAKFYRRYSHEAILAFVTMEDPKPSLGPTPVSSPIPRYAPHRCHLALSRRCHPHL
jgi:hypothetical protein